MSKRDYAAEILMKRSRLFLSSKRWERVAVHLSNLGEAAELLDLLHENKATFTEQLADIDSSRLELEKYIPIRSVACVEGYFRQLYADLIDYGEPYRKNASKFDQIKFSIETALDLQKSSISIGEFIAHLLPLSSLEDIDFSMTRLMDESFLGRLKKVRNELPKQLTLDGEDDFGYLLNVIKGMFTTRHIHCHEIGTAPSSEQVSHSRFYYRRTVEFLSISERLGQELLR